MARKEKFHTFEAEVAGRIQEKIECESQVHTIDQRLALLANTKPEHRMHEVEIQEEKKRLHKQKDEYKDCHVEYLLDIMPHIREYAQCVTTMQNNNNKPETPQRYMMGSVYKNYQLAYNRNIDFDNPIGYYKCSDVDKCPECGNIYMIWDSVTSTSICDKCGHSIVLMMNATVNATFGQTGPVQTKYAYKRINHFNEWLNSFQAKENTTIEPALLELVAKEFKKNRYFAQSDITPCRVKMYLKVLKLTKYYEHSTQIASNLSGIPAKIITGAQEKRLRSMFQIIQIPFDKVCPPDRKNFPSYSYILHKFCELLMYDDIVDKFPLLKSREKLFQLDNIWRDICMELNWQFIKSI